MLKRMSLKKILVCLLVLFSITLLNFIPKKDIDVKEEVVYVKDNPNTSYVYLENNNYLTRVNIEVKNKDTIKKARELVEDLIRENKNLPKNFKGIIPSSTKINSIKYTDNAIKIDFTNDLLDVKKDYEEKVIEAIVYTLTSIEDVDYVIIYINGELLTYLPKSNKHLPSSLDRNFGINKEYKLTNDKDITSTTIYYISNIDNKDYYIPVTKINNDTRDKVEIIVEELSNQTNNKLMSYLNSNTKLISSNIDQDNISLVFNDYILNDSNYQDILKEVIDTICLSIKDNYQVKTVSFNINNQEINKTDLKSLE